LALSATEDVLRRFRFLVDDFDVDFDFDFDFDVDVVVVAVAKNALLLSSMAAFHGELNWMVKLRPASDAMPCCQ
jgi:hypothetical protein